MCLVCLICVRIAIYKEHRLDTHNNKPAIDRIFWLEPTLSTATYYVIQCLTLDYILYYTFLTLRHLIISLREFFILKNKSIQF